VTVQYLAGTFCDVAIWIDGRLLAGTADGPLFRCFLEGSQIWQQPTAENLLFCRVAVQGNKFLSVHQGQTGAALLVGEGWAVAKGTTFGVQPVGIDAHEAYIVRSATAYDRVGLISQPYPSGAPGSSQGLSDVKPDGTLWWADQHRTLTVGGVLLHYPNVRGPVTVGQVDPPGIAAVMEWDDIHGHHATVTRVLEGNCFEPHVAVSPTGRVAICARTDRGAAYVATTLDELKG
jgi:hypothetical protein